ncbi:MAG: SDR family NAD(P)-dependent oxidoreductase, partial [Parvularculaceae bacterium]|nr:SDR family NAD(P)-dependent oxidoreductase [Parvularculaceae bacterium]
AEALRAIGGDVVLHALDVSAPEDVAAMARAADEPVDVVVANAALGARDVGEFGAVDYARFAHVLAVNVLGAVALAEAFAPHVRRAKGRIAMLSSELGSIADSSGGSLAYRTSKSALNMATTVIAADLARDGVAVAPFHPGWVQTDMGGPRAPTPVADSVRGLRSRIAEMRPTPRPSFLDFAGRRLPW